MNKFISIIISKIKFLSALLIISSSFLSFDNAAAQYSPGAGFSGIVTLDTLPDNYFANQVLPAAVMVNYAANTYTGDCALSFLGVTCLGRLQGNSCTFKSEDCDGPAGWKCSVYEKTSNEYGSVYRIACDSIIDPRLSFSYSGSAQPDLAGFRIERQ